MIFGTIFSNPDEERIIVFVSININGQFKIQNKKVIDYYPMNTANLHGFKRKNSKKIEKVHKN